MNDLIKADTNFLKTTDCKESACNAGDLGLSLDLEDPLEKGTVFLPGERRRHRSLVGYSPWGHRDLDTTEHADMVRLGPPE